MRSPQQRRGFHQPGGYLRKAGGERLERKRQAVEDRTHNQPSEGERQRMTDKSGKQATEPGMRP